MFIKAAANPRLIYIYIHINLRDGLYEADLVELELEDAVVGAEPGLAQLPQRLVEALGFLGALGPQLLELRLRRYVCDIILYYIILY